MYFRSKATRRTTGVKKDLHHVFQRILRAPEISDIFFTFLRRYPLDDDTKRDYMATVA